MQKLKSLASDSNILIIAALILFTIFIIDTMTPLGKPVWLLYFVPLTLSYWSSRNYAIPMVCVVTLLFLGAGYFLSPPGGEVFQVIFFRSNFYLVFIFISAILWIIRRGQIREETL